MVSSWKSRLPLVYQRVPHAGPQVARNLGASLTDGEFLLFSDSDVIFRPDAFATFVRELHHHPGAAYAYCDYERIGLSHQAHIARPFDASALKRRNYISMVSLLRRSAFVGFDERIRRLQDWDFWLNLLLHHGRKGAYIPQPLFQAWVRPHGISNDARDDAVPLHEAVQIVRRKYGLPT